MTCFDFGRPVWKPLAAALAAAPIARIKEEKTMSYANQANWREIQQFLPEAFRLSPGQEPAEEWWPWRGHRIHLDTYRNPQADVKVILFHGVGTNGRQMSLILDAPLEPSPSSCRAMASPRSAKARQSVTRTGCRPAAA